MINVVTLLREHILVASASFGQQGVFSSVERSVTTLQKLYIARSSNAIPLRLTSVGYPYLLTA